MSRKKGKKGTPPKLDKYFERKIISRDDYGKFWQGYWKAKENQRENYVSKWVGTLIKQAPKKAISFLVTHSKTQAIRDAESVMGVKYRIVRRDRFGQFNSRGKSFQAVKSPKEKRK